LLLNDEVGKNKKADRTTTAIVHTLRDTHHSQTVMHNKKEKNRGMQQLNCLVKKNE